MLLRSGATKYNRSSSIDMGDNNNLKDLLLPLENSLKEIQLTLDTNITKIEKSITDIKFLFEEKLKVHSDRVGMLYNRDGVPVLGTPKTGTL